MSCLSCHNIHSRQQSNSYPLVNFCSFIYSYRLSSSHVMLLVSSVRVAFKTSNFNLLKAFYRAICTIFARLNIINYMHINWFIISINPQFVSIKELILPIRTRIRSFSSGLEQFEVLQHLFVGCSNFSLKEQIEEIITITLLLRYIQHFIVIF